MLQRDIVGLPTSIYPPEPWALVERELSSRYMAEAESIFAISNGFIGMRAVHDEGRPFVERGALVNGLHEQWPILHPERAFGFAEVGQTIIAAPDPRRFHLYVDDEPLDLRHADIRDYERRLDFRAGTLTRRVEWRLPTGVVVRVESEAMTSLVQRHLVAVRYRVQVLEGRAHVVVSSQIAKVHNNRDDSEDPRAGKGFSHEVLVNEGHQGRGGRAVLRYRVPTSGMTMACGMDHAVDGEALSTDTLTDESRARFVVAAELADGAALQLSKFATFHTSAVNHDGHPTRSARLADRCHRTLDRAVLAGYDTIVAEQRAFLDDFWERADVEVLGNATVCQATRWSLFQLCQATARADTRGIPAKGLTGIAYEGHYFWDAEIYVLPFLAYTNPRLARNLLRFRHGMLSHARRRAGQVNQRGALFPWRTITGEEASAFFEAGTAQYHINADISYAVNQYARVTGDVDFLAEHGAEILVETARLWADLGFFRETTEGRETFHIHGVTGPDEYTTVVDDNAYTNLMAAANMADAARVVGWLAAERPEDYSRLLRRTSLHSAEVALWRRAAEAMFVPYDEELGITPQDAHFLGLQRWDFEGVPRDRYPLLLHFHPLVIYRYQVIKQADVVLAMFLRPEQFAIAHQTRNFDYYDPLTTGDSSLSTAIQSIVAARIGNEAKAIEYFRYGVFMDLANVAGNTGDGVHIAAAGGVWLAVVNGFGGLTDTGEVPAFDPRLPSSWDGLRFRLTLRGRRLQVDVARHATTFTLLDGDALEISHAGELVRLEPGRETVVEVSVPAVGDGPPAHRPVLGEPA